jgi:mono/diheme cytochrome c family protein
METKNEPLHVNMNMDFQERMDPQEANTFFEDRRAMRTPPRGTVARGLLQADERFFAGRDQAGQFVPTMPIPITEALLRRGQERYNIYCSVCHGIAGDGLGIIMTGQYGYTPAPTYHDTRLRQAADGYLYEVIVNGVRSMPSYAQQIAVADRWAIVAYIRALQRSQGATRADIPENVTQLPVVGVQDSTASGQPTNDSLQTGAATPGSTGQTGGVTGGEAASPPAATPPAPQP